jgi:hypothetical protein
MQSLEWAGLRHTVIRDPAVLQIPMPASTGPSARDLDEVTGTVRTTKGALRLLRPWATECASSVAHGYAVVSEPSGTKEEALDCAAIACT